MAIVCATHVPLFVVDRALLAFESASFAGGQPPALDALGDAILLIHFSLLNRLASLRKCGGRAQRDECRSVHKKPFDCHGMSLSELRSANSVCAAEASIE